MKTEESSWLDDAFDEKKAAEEAERAKGHSTMFAGIGCVVVVIALVVLLFVSLVGTVGILAS